MEIEQIRDRKAAFTARRFEALERKRQAHRSSSGTQFAEMLRDNNVVLYDRLLSEREKIEELISRENEESINNWGRNDEIVPEDELPARSSGKWEQKVRSINREQSIGWTNEVVESTLRPSFEDPSSSTMAHILKKLNEWKAQSYHVMDETRVDDLIQEKIE